MNLTNALCCDRVNSRLDVSIAVGDSDQGKADEDICGPSTRYVRVSASTKMNSTGKLTTGDAFNGSSIMLEAARRSHLVVVSPPHQSISGGNCGWRVHLSGDMTEPTK